MSEIWYQTLEGLSDDLFIWIREYIFSLILQRQGTHKLEAKALRNASDFADFFTIFYGKPRTEQLKALLTQHVSLISELAATVRSGQDYLPLRDSFYQNAYDIAGFFSEINPNLNEEVLKELLQARYYQEESLIWELYNQDFQGAISHYNESFRVQQQISNYITEGMEKQFNLYHPAESTPVTPAYPEYRLSPDAAQHGTP